MPAKKRRTSSEPSASGDFYKSLADRLSKKVGDNVVVDPYSNEFTMSAVKEYISTQCYGLNWAMHLPGIPVGRVTAIRGDFMSGKSTFAQHIAAETQRMGGYVVYLDTEMAFDEKRAQAIGIDLSPDKWMLIQVQTVESAVTTLRELINEAKERQDAGEDRLFCVIWDSVGATATEAEMAEDFGAARPGLHARLLSAALRQLTPGIAAYRIALILVNQERDRVDFFSMGKDVKTMIAERPIMFHSSIVLRPQYIKTLTNSKKEPVGVRVVVTVKKNKLAAPFSKVEAVIRFANGVDNAASILAIAYQQKIVKQAGAWYSYEGQKFYEKDFPKILAEHPEIMEQLEELRQRDSRDQAKAPDSDDEFEGEEDDGD